MAKNKIDISPNYVLKQLKSYGYDITKADLREKVEEIIGGKERPLRSQVLHALKTLMLFHSKYFHKSTAIESSSGITRRDEI